MGLLRNKHYDLVKKNLFQKYKHLNCITVILGVKCTKKTGQ